MFWLRFLCKLCVYKTNQTTHLDRHILSVHPAAAVDTSVTNTSTKKIKNGTKQTKNKHHNSDSFVFPGRSSI